MLLEGLSGAYRLRLDAAESGTDIARARVLLATAAGADPADARRLLDEVLKTKKKYSDVEALLAAIYQQSHGKKEE